MLDKVREAIDRHRLVSRGETVVVGVSGGADSLCLLHVLHRLSAEYDLRLHVAHLHHGLRGEDADADAAFVSSLAETWGLPCTVERADVRRLANERRLAIEEAARRARYWFLSRVAEATGSLVIAVGHNADDQAETVLMHWIRGSGLAGLRGMLPSTLLAEYRLLEPLEGNGTAVAGLRLIRPLLNVTRYEIESYCREHGLQPRFDLSNLDTTYFRNWLRLEVLPILAEHNPNIREVLCRAARVIADDYALLRSLLEETWPRVVVEQTAESIRFDLARWRSLPLSLQRATLREAISRLRRNLRDIVFVHVENALDVVVRGHTGAQATLPRGLMLTLGYDEFHIANVSQVEACPGWPMLPAGREPLPVAMPGTTELPDGGWLLETALVDRRDLPLGWEENRDPWLAYMGAHVTDGSLFLRTRQPGDRFQPFGMGGRAVKLSGFLINNKVPRHLRDRLPLLADASGVLWVCGLRIDERARVDEGTSQVMVCRFVRSGELEI